MSLIRFFVYFSFLAALVYGAGILAQTLLPQVLILSPNFTLLIGFLFILTLLAFILSYFGIKKSAELGVFALLGGSVLKMIFALTFVFLLFRNSPENQFVLVLNFFSIYFLFTIFEVIVLLRILRDQNKT